MPYTVSLCVYCNPDGGITDVGHAFVVLRDGNTVSAAAGLSPAMLPESAYDEFMTIFPKAGKIYTEFDSLENDNLRSRTWPITNDGFIASSNKINADRRQNVSSLPDGSSMTGEQLIREWKQAKDQDGTDWSGGPGYQLIWSNCITYALDVVEVAGIDVGEYRRLVQIPRMVWNMLQTG